MMTSEHGLAKDFDQMKLHSSGLHTSGLAHEHVPTTTTTTIHEEKFVKRSGSRSSSSSSSEGEYTEEGLDAEGRPIKKKRGLGAKIKGLFRGKKHAEEQHY
jgi:hypothetical protein